MGSKVPAKKKRQYVSDQLEGKLTEFAKALPPSMDPERFLRVGLTAIVHNPKLLNCSIESIYLALLDSARSGLMPDGVEAALVPYGSKAEFQEMYQGLARLMMRHGGAAKVESRIVREGDDFEYAYGLEPVLSHRPAPESERGDTTHAYAWAVKDNGEKVFEVVDREDLDKAEKQSRSTGKAPAWDNWPDQMRRKVAVKRLAKYFDLAPEAQRALDLDTALETGDSLGASVARARADEKKPSEAILEDSVEATREDLKERIHEAKSEEVDDEPEEPQEEDEDPEEDDDPFEESRLRGAVFADVERVREDRGLSWSDVAQAAAEALDVHPDEISIAELSADELQLTLDELTPEAGE